jgi:outer membrane lipoprotein-sorting protein
MRVEYNKPTPVLIIANGSVLAYTDLELEETSYLSTNSTPASFLTRKNFSFFAKDVEITDFEKSTDTIKVGIVKKNKKEAGTFSLIFKTNPLRFVKMEVKNDLDEITKVSFTTVKFDETIDDQLFVIKNKNLPE